MRKNKRPLNNYASISLVDVIYYDPLYSQKHPHMLHHHKDVLELLYIASDSGHYIVGDYEYSVTAGDMIVCNAGIPHGEDPFQEHSIQTFCLAFTGVSLPKLPPCHAIADDSRPVLSLGERNYITATLLPSLYQMFHAKEDNYEICLHLAIGILLMTRQMIVERDKNLTPSAIKKAKLIYSITDYINNHYKEALTLKEISDAVYMSKSYLSTLFKQESGLSPIQYMMQRRIGEAQSLLIETLIPVTEIGYSLGFSSDPYFSKMFKKYVGITPSEYRQHFSKRYKK